MSLDSLSNSVPGIGVFPRKAFSIAAPEDCHIQTVTVYLHAFNPESLDQRIKVEFHKRATTEELIEKIFDEKRSGKFFVDSVVIPYRSTGSCKIFWTQDGTEPCLQNSLTAQQTTAPWWSLNVYS